MVFSGASEKSKVIIVAVELALLVLIIRVFGIQDPAFQNLSVLILVAFLIHSFLPLQYRLPFFSLFSIASVFIVFGKINGAVVVVLGLILIGICHLPIRFALRVGLVLFAGALLATLRMDWLSAPWSETVWPILGGMFMFRLIIYLYDIKHDTGRPSIARVVSYFFMVPNVCFPLFPVVDYKKFHRNYYNEDPPLIYQRGISWIFRGLLHLLLYRLVYHYLATDPGTAEGLAGVLQFSFSAFLLYLQVSGAFHMIVGILLLFGFNLPETNHLYFFASSFNDFWRRINIYWKDFMMKVFYYPTYFKVKALGETKAIIISTFVVFFATWFLHAYQWFWLRGVFLFEWHDALYWMILAVLVVVNSLYETRFGRQRSLRQQSRTIWDYSALICGTLGTFLTVGLLWGMWASDSLAQWQSMWATTGGAWIAILLVIPSLFGLSILLERVPKREKTAAAQLRPQTIEAGGFWRAAAISVTSMVLILSLGSTAMSSRLPSEAASLVEATRGLKLNERDRVQLTRGYYENLTRANRHSAALWSIKQMEPDDWGFAAEPGAQTSTGDFLIKKLTPHLDRNVKNARLTTNQWGMRDQNYDIVKPINVLRIAMLGSSYVVAAGVEDGQTFEAIFEEMLNKGGGGETSYEVLNFAVPGRTVMQQVWLLESPVVSFDPDAMFYVGHTHDKRRSVAALAEIVKDGVDVPYPYLQSIVERAGITGLNRFLQLDVLERRLMPYGDEILNWSFKRLADLCRTRDILPVWVLLPVTAERLRSEEVSELISVASSAGFVTIDLSDVYGDHKPDTLALTPWDRHPNVLGHKLIAEGLYNAVQTQGVISKPRAVYRKSVTNLIQPHTQEIETHERNRR